MSKSVISRACLIADPCSPGCATGWRNAEAHYVQNVGDRYAMVPMWKLDWYLVFDNNQMFSVRIRFEDGNPVIRETRTPRFGSLDKIISGDRASKFLGFYSSLRKREVSTEGIWDGAFKWEGEGVYNFYDSKELESDRDILIPASNVWDSIEQVTFPNYALIHRPRLPLGLVQADNDKVASWWKHTQAMFEAECFHRGIDIRPEEAHELAKKFMETNDEEVTLDMNTRNPAFYDLGTMILEAHDGVICGRTNVGNDTPSWKFDVKITPKRSRQRCILDMFRL